MLGILINAHHRETQCDVRHVDNLNMEVNKKHCFEYEQGPVQGTSRYRYTATTGGPEGSTGVQPVTFRTAVQKR